jgi:hypothetical protein
MPAQAYDTQMHSPLQACVLNEEIWERDVLSRLPCNFAQEARRLGAFQRKRGVSSPATLLRALLAYTLGVLSFRQLGAWAVLLGVADISEAAWRKRLRRSRRWLAWLLREQIALPQATPPSFGGAHARIQLVDATRLSHPGGSGDDWRVHLAYDLLGGRLGQVMIGDQHSGEHLERYELAAGDIAVADGAYGSRRSVAHARGQGADVVLRITKEGFPLQRENGEPFEVAAWLKRTRRSLRQEALWCRFEGHSYRVRLIGIRLPPDKAELARKRLLRNACRHQYKLRPETLALAEWVLLVTTLPQEGWPLEQILRLYRARWQVELVFKRMKQLLHLDTLRVKERDAVEAAVCLQLIAWTLHEEQAAWMRAHLPSASNEASADTQTAPSSWRLTALCLSTLRHAVLGQWTQQRVRECLGRLQRFLCDSPRKRQHQESTLRDSFALRLLQQAPSTGDIHPCAA